MARSDAKTGGEKHVAFKRAFSTIKIYQEQKNYLAAYVVTFSVIEDRLRALFVMWYRLQKSAEPTAKQIAGPFTKIVRTLQDGGDISNDFAKVLTEEAQKRNELLHAAMWNLEVFDDMSVRRALKIARELDSITRRMKKSI